MRKLLIGIICIFAAIAAFAYFNYTSPGPLTEETTVILPRGLGFQHSVTALAEAKIISQPLLFKAISAASGNARKFKAGEYRFPAGITPQEVADMLVSGKVVVHKMTVAEGLNVREVRALLEAETILTGDMPANIEEGSLLPETYYFTYGDTKQDMVSRMQNGMKKTLVEAWEKRVGNLPFSTPQEALTLASIVEKETGLPAERPRVAAVFINRLRRGIPLQSDPTTIYGIEQQTGKKLERSLTTNDLKNPTPYNPYTIPALPPGPIANPSRASIEAVLNPLDTDELYFVAIGDGSGGHRFAPTLGAHNKNVAAYRALLKK